MSALNTLALLIATYVVVFLESHVNWLRQFLGVQPDALPVLMVYCGLSANLAKGASVAIVGGLLFDSLSANPLGVTTLSLLMVGYLLYLKRELILRDQLYAQFVLGAAASVAVPAVSLLVLFNAGYEPLVGWGTLWQMTVLALVGGFFTPLCFWFFDRIEKVFAYQRIPESSFREDREIKRGRD